MAVDLSGYNNIKFWIKSTRTGTYLQFGIGESAWDDNTWAIEILIADTWEQKEIDISEIADVDKNAIRHLGIKCTNADSTFTFKYDDINTFKPEIQTLIETGSGVDKWVLPEAIFITFSDSGTGSEILLIDKVLLFIETGSGAESWIVDKLREFADSGVGIDVFLRDWTPIFTDLGSGVEAYYKVFHYPVNLKRVIILIRDKK